MRASHGARPRSARRAGVAATARDPPAHLGPGAQRRRDPRRDARRHLRRRLAATARADRSRARRVARRAPPPVLPRAAGEPRSGARGAGAHVGPFAVAAEARRRTGAEPARTASAETEKTQMTTLPFRLDRSIVIHARRPPVFRFFTDSKRWASWWGDGSTIDARPGGHVLIRYPGGLEAVGEVVEVASPERIVFTYGYASGERIPPGGSRVTLRLDADGDRT